MGAHGLALFLLPQFTMNGCRNAFEHKCVYQYLCWLLIQERMFVHVCSSRNTQTTSEINSAEFVTKT